MPFAPTHHPMTSPLGLTWLTRYRLQLSFLLRLWSGLRPAFLLLVALRLLRLALSLRLLLSELLCARLLLALLRLNIALLCLCILVSNTTYTVITFGRLEQILASSKSQRFSPA